MGRKNKIKFEVGTSNFAEDAYSLQGMQQEMLSHTLLDTLMT
jgi:hypothetical protein